MLSTDYISHTYDIRDVKGEVLVFTFPALCQSFSICKTLPKHQPDHQPHEINLKKWLNLRSKTSELWYVINFAAHLLHFYSKALLSTSNHIHPYCLQTMHIAIDAVNFSALIPISTAATNQIVQSRKGTDLKTVQSQTFQCGAEQTVHIFINRNIIWEYCEGIMWA